MEDPSLIDSLKQICEVQRDEMLAYILKFQNGEVTTTIRVEFEELNGLEMVITNMTTLPRRHIGEGCGSKALQTLLSWASAQRFKNILAVQVQRRAENFWTKNGFAACRNKTNDFEFKRPLDPD